MFKVNGGRGFHITFPNEVILSTQFGYGNYCDNYDRSELRDSKNLLDNDVICRDAEVAVLYKDIWITDDMYREVFGHRLDNNVLGSVDIIMWLKILEWCKNCTPLEILLKR